MNRKTKYDRHFGERIQYPNKKQRMDGNERQFPNPPLPNFGYPGIIPETILPKKSLVSFIINQLPQSKNNGLFDQNERFIANILENFSGIHDVQEFSKRGPVTQKNNNNEAKSNPSKNLSIINVDNNGFVINSFPYPPKNRANHAPGNYSYKWINCDVNSKTILNSPDCSSQEADEESKEDSSEFLNAENAFGMALNTKSSNVPDSFIVHSKSTSNLSQISELEESNRTNFDDPRSSTSCSEQSDIATISQCDSDQQEEYPEKATFYVVDNNGAPLLHQVDTTIDYRKFLGEKEVTNKPTLEDLILEFKEKKDKKILSTILFELVSKYGISDVSEHVDTIIANLDNQDSVVDCSKTKDQSGKDLGKSVEKPDDFLFDMEPESNDDATIDYDVTEMDIDTSSKISNLSNNSDQFADSEGLPHKTYKLKPESNIDTAIEIARWSPDSNVFNTVLLALDTPGSGIL